MSSSIVPIPDRCSSPEEEVDPESVATGEGKFRGVKVTKGRYHFLFLLSCCLQPVPSMFAVWFLQSLLS